MLSSAVQLLKAEDLTALGIEADRFLALLKQRIEQLRQQPDSPFRDLNIPVQDLALSAYVTPVPGYEPDEYICNKHTLRDRSEVIAARESERLRRRAGGDRERFS